MECKCCQELSVDDVNNVKIADYKKTSQKMREKIQNQITNSDGIVM